jgi:hypothetical protein
MCLCTRSCCPGVPREKREKQRYPGRELPSFSCRAPPLGSLPILRYPFRRFRRQSPARLPLSRDQRSAACCWGGGRMGRRPLNGAPGFRFFPAEIAEMEAIARQLTDGAIFPTSSTIQALAARFSTSAARAGMVTVRPKQVNTLLACTRRSIKLRLRSSHRTHDLFSLSLQSVWGWGLRC